MSSNRAFQQPRRTRSAAALERKRRSGETALAWLHRQAAENKDAEDAEDIAYIETRLLEAPSSPSVNPSQITIDVTPRGTFTVSDGSGHTIEVPFHINGLRLLRNFILARQQKPKAKLAEAHKPTQEMIKTFLKNRELEKEIELEKKMEELKELF